MPIVRLFNTTEDAMAAVNELKDFKYGRVGIQLVAETEDPFSFESMKEMGVPDAEAQRFSERVGNGGALVVADPPFGSGARVVEILERSRSSDSGLSRAMEVRAPDTGYNGPDQDDAAPLSRALGLPLLSNNPAPLSSYFKIPTLLRRQNPKPAPLGLPLLSNKAAPFSSAVGVPVLSRDAAPFSSLIGMKVLTDDPAPLSSLLKMPVLTKDKPRSP